MTRQEHLQWCKERALEYCNKGDLKNAFASMISDMGKHEETQGHMATELGAMLLIGGHLDTVHQMEQWINGFN